MDVLEKTDNELASDTKKFLGETITLQISSLDDDIGYTDLEFKGVVTTVKNIKGFHQHQGDLISIHAQSSSIITDDGPHYTSYSDVSLSEILENTFRGYNRSTLATNINPQNQQNISYSVQHNESSFEYARRLAAQHSEWFYYDGRKLVFGQPEEEETTELHYGFDLQEFSLQLHPIPNKFKYFTNDYLADDQHEVATAEINSGINGYNGFTNNKSEEIYTKETSIFLNSVIDTRLRQRLDTYVACQKKAVEIKQVKINGVSDNPGVHLGQIIKIKDEQKDHGSFRIISVSHSSTENGKYQNQFVGISKDLDVYPNTDMSAFPKSESQIAIVKDNADPEKMGRIRAQFFWQKATGEMTPWIRIMTPHAGGDKGFHFIPEKEEEVIIGFEGGNAERPYVMGSLYTGNSKPEASWETDKNDIKAIRTRGGHTLSFCDESGGESISITDKNGNAIVLDTVKKTISISAPDSISISSKDISISGSNSINISGSNISASGENVSVSGSSKTAITSDAQVIVDGKTSVNVNSNMEVAINGMAKSTITSSGVTSVEGTIIKLN
ncbi:phage baseplate assembly protein V [Aquimarina addita]|uniref:Phage baseplate assembly protein V n=2 Tax=Aquimarina addita TaxID=870485 RepID=A0ABP6UIK7_9FLAO